MTHLFRPADAPDAPYSPSWRQWRGLLAVEGRRLLVTIAGLFRSRLARAVSVHVLLWIGLLCQAVALFALAYMVDLSLSLMELWAELARKHLELTL